MAKRIKSYISHLLVLCTAICFNVTFVYSIYAQTVDQPRPEIKPGQDIQKSGRADIMSEIIMLRQLNSQLESYVPSLRQQNDQLNTRVKQLEKRIAAIEGRSENDPSSIGVSVSQAEKDNMAKELASMRRYAKDLEGTISKLRASAPDGTGAFDNVVKERDSLRAEVEKLRSASRAGGGAEEFEAMKRARDSAANDLAHLTKYTRELEAKISRNKEMDSTTQARLDGLGKVLEERDYYRSEAERLRREADSTPRVDNTELGKITKEKESLSREVNRLKSYSQQLETRISDMKDSSVQTASRMDDLGKAVQERDLLRSEVDRLKREAQSAISMDDYFKIKQEKESLASEISKAKQANEQADSYNASQLNELSQRLSYAMKTQAALMADLNKTKQEKDSAAGEAQELKQSVRDMDKLAAENAELRSRVSMQTQAIVNIGKEKDSLSYELTRMRNDNQTLVKPEDYERLRIENESIGQQNANLARYKTALEASIARMKDTNAILEAKARDYDRIAMDIEKARKDLDGLKKETMTLVRPEVHARLSREKDVLAGELVSAKENVAILENNLGKLTEARVGLESTVQYQSEKLNTLSNIAVERDDLHKELERVKQDNIDLEDAVTGLQKSNLLLEAKAKDLEKITSIILKK